MADKSYRIGIDLGGTNIKVGVIDEQAVLLGKLSAKTRPYDRSWQEVVADMAGLVTTLLDEHGIPLSACEKLGVGSPGMIDHKSGVVVFAGNFNWEDVPLVEQLQRHFELPIRLANDANCAVMGEAAAGAAKGCSDVVLLTLGTGVGGGVIAGGVLQQGGGAGGMELGHTLLVMDGESCTCGRKGCIEAYASADALVRNTKYAAMQHSSSMLHKIFTENPDSISGKTPFDVARAGDVWAQQVVDDYVRYLGEGIINFINIWRPEKVILGGGVSNEGAPLLKAVNEYVSTRVFAGERRAAPEIVRAELGNDAGLIGAAALV